MIIKLASVLALLILIRHYATAIEDSGVVCREEEKEALLDFKLSFTADPNGALSDWTPHNPDCCQWGGVTCDGNTGHVVTIEFYWQSLVSHQLRPSLLVLQHLTSLNLMLNNFTMKIPEFIGSFPKLADLELSNSGFYGKIPPQLGNLTSLETLQIEDTSGLLYADDLKWLSHLSSIQLLDLSGANLSNATDWLTTLKKLPSLSGFYCSPCSLPNVPPLGSSLCSHNHSTSLQSLYLSYNHISSSSFLCLINGTNNLNRLSLASMNPGQNPIDFFKPLFQNAARLMLFPMLQNLDISGNRLIELMLPQMPKLEILDISHNLLNTVPDLSAFSSLVSLDASFNRLNGSLYANLQQLPKNLTTLDLSANSLNDVISDAHFSKFSSLTELSLSENYLLTFNFSKPPFQLRSLYLSSCELGPWFPNWLLTQKTLQMLDISNSSIAGVVPSAFWNHITGLSNLNVSNNKLEGTLPNLSLVFNNLQYIDLSFNEFHGPIPLFMFMAPYLELSNNKFSSLPPIQHGVSNLSSSQINLSNNLLSGSLPDWIFQITSLVGLNLAYNMFSGAIPSTIASSGYLNALHLNSNRLSGELPSSMKNCSQLVILELGNNNFSGSLPFWLGDNLQLLIVLSLRSNNFSGDLPSNLCQLQRLQVLDLSGNKISGSIPGCVRNFTSMATDEGFSITLSASGQSYIFYRGPVEYLDYATIVWKGILVNESSGNLPQWNVIDLSDNHLMGEIPSGVTSLKYLRSLDLSRNNINGSIPDKIDQLRFLEVLKLSSNRLQGEIPQSLAGLTFLSTLNLSSNNLTGRIPKSTQLQSFDPSSYSGNPGLCGEPLPTKCPGDKSLVTPPTIAIDQTGKKDHETFDMEAFFAALGTGFSFGLLGILGILNFHAPSRHAFFHMASEVGDWIFVRTYLCQSKIKRSIGF